MPQQLANTKKNNREGVSPGVVGGNIFDHPSSFLMMALQVDSLGSPLEKYFQTNLKLPHSEKIRLHCHVLSDHFSELDWSSQSYPSPYISHTEYLTNRHLILVSQNQIGSPNKKRPEGPILVLGLCVVEYAKKHQSMNVDDSSISTKIPGAITRSYIQYVDTTGLIKPRSLQGLLTRNLVKTYIRYARDILHVSFIHLFASPKPSLLFAGTEQIGKKVLLTGKQLISWWLAIMIDALCDSEHCTIHAFAPGEELLPASARFTRICVEKLAKDYSASNFHLQYGVPYRPDDSALNHVPAFRDDPKWRHLEALLEEPLERSSRKRQRKDQSSLTVREFFETLAYRSDFANDHSALLCASFENCSSSIPDTPIRYSETATCVLNILKTISFETELEAYKSSSRIFGLLKMLGVTGFPFESWNIVENLENRHPETQDRFKQILSLLKHANDNAHKHSSDSVSDLQTFIKRKTPRSSMNNAIP